MFAENQKVSGLGVLLGFDDDLPGGVRGSGSPLPSRGPISRSPEGPEPSAGKAAHMRDADCP